MPVLDIPDGDIDVLCIGEASVDFIAEEDAPQLRDAATFRRNVGGSPVNIAMYLAKLGKRASVIAKTGIGAFGTFLKGEMRASGVDDTYLVMDHRVHTTVIFVSRTTGTPEFETFRDGDFKLEPKDVPTEAVLRSRIVHASTFALSRPPARYAVEKAFERAHEAGKIVSFDPNYSPVVWPQTAEALEIVKGLFHFATITKPSLDDCQRLFGDQAEPEDYITRFHEMGPKIVVLTMGRDGSLVSDGSEIIHLPAHQVKVVDATGAGDSYWAGFLTALLDGHGPAVCGAFARSVVERKLQSAGHIVGPIDAEEIYTEILAEPDYSLVAGDSEGERADGP